MKSGLPGRVAAYADAASGDRYYMLATGYGAATHPGPAAYRRQIALRAVSLGLLPLVRLGSWGLRRLRRWKRVVG